MDVGDSETDGGWTGGNTALDDGLGELEFAGESLFGGSRLQVDGIVRLIGIRLVGRPLRKLYLNG